MHDSTFQLTFGGQTLVAVGDTIASEPEFARTPASPQVALPLRASAARLFGGRNLTHSLSWSVRREFPSIAEARAYEWSRMASLPEGARTLIIADSGITTTLIDAHLTNYSLQHVRGQAGLIIESVSAVGGALSTVGSVVVPEAVPQPNPPQEVDVSPSWLLAGGQWDDGGFWTDGENWQDSSD